MFHVEQSETVSEQTKNGNGRTIQLTEEQFRVVLEAMAVSAGNKAEFAPKLGISAQYLGDVIAGRKHPGPKILKALNARRTVIYELEVTQ